MPKQGRPAAAGRGPGYNTGAVSENRVAWLATYVGQIAIMMYPEGYRDDDPNTVPSIKAEPGPTVRLAFVKNGRSSNYTLTALTSEELKLMKELFNLAFDLAEPIVEQRDKAAQDAYENGDDAFVRIYRQVPRLVVRERAIRENSGSLRDGSADAAGGDREGPPPDGGVRGDRPGLADVEPEEARAQDDQPSSD